MRFDRATERPREVVLGAGGKEGKREAEREVTARMLLRVVRGSWGRAAERAEGSQVSLLGMEGWGCQRAGVWELGLVCICVLARRSPRRKIPRA